MRTAFQQKVPQQPHATAAGVQAQQPMVNLSGGVGAGPGDPGIWDPEVTLRSRVLEVGFPIKPNQVVRDTRPRSLSLVVMLPAAPDTLPPSASETAAAAAAAPAAVTHPPHPTPPPPPPPPPQQQQQRQQQQQQQRAGSWDQVQCYDGVQLGYVPQRRAYLGDLATWHTVLEEWGDWRLHKAGSVSRRCDCLL
jgi:hypothetical protein